MPGQIETDLCSLFLDQASAEDFETVLSFSGNIYEGRDYIKQVYFEWIREEKSDPRRRRNLVLKTRSGQVLGYQSLWFQDDFRKVLCLALRVAPEYRGIGIGRRFMELTREFAFRICPEAVELKTLWNNLVEGCNDVKKVENLGRPIGSQIGIFFNLPKEEEVNGRLDRNNEWTSELKQYDNNALAGLYDKNKTFFLNKVFIEDYLMIMWIPHFISSSKDIISLNPYSAGIRTLVEFEEGDNEETRPKSMSIMTMPYVCEAGYSFGLDVYTKDHESLIKHCKNQLKHVMDIVHKRGIINETIILWFCCNLDLHPWAEEFLSKDLKLEPRDGKTYAPPWKRTFAPKFYLFEKPLQEENGN